MRVFCYKDDELTPSPLQALKLAQRGHFLGHLP